MLRTSTRFTPMHNKFLSAASTDLCDGTIQLVKSLIDENPQIDESGNLRYFFAGSIAMNLLAFTAGYFETDVQFQRVAASAARKIHDIDVVVCTGHQAPETELLFADQSRLARTLFQEPFADGRLSFDTYLEIGEELTAVCLIGGRQVYFRHPVGMLATKLIFVLRNFSLGPAAKTKLKGDWEKLLSLNSSIDRKRLIDEAQKALDNHSPATLSWFNNHTTDDEFSGTVKQFVDELIHIHPQSLYLERLECGTNYSIAILRLLDRLTSAGEKVALMDFFNRHVDLVGWEKVPRFADVLDVLDTVPEGQLQVELEKLDQLLARPIAPSALHRILASASAHDSRTRSELYSGLEKACETLSDGRLFLFVSDLVHSTSQAA